MVEGFGESVPLEGLDVGAVRSRVAVELHLTFDMYFSSLVAIRFHPPRSMTKGFREEVELCARMALAMLEVRSCALRSELSALR